MFNSPKRPIQYPLNRSLVSESETPDEEIQNFPFAWSTANADERVAITLDLSLNEFIVLSSAIDVGSDIAYGDDAIQVWWLWVRAVNTMPLCDLITACINTNVGTQEAIINVVGGAGSGGVSSGGVSGSGATTIIIQNINQDDIMAGSGCSSDNMYAVATQISILAFEVMTQVYQALNLALQPLALATELADNAPAVATAIPASAGDWVLWIQNTAQALWETYDTPQERIDVACDIFCIMVEAGCVLTFDDIAGYFYSKSPISIIGKSINEIILDMVTLNLVDGVGNTSLAFMFAVLSIGSKIGGVQNVGGFLTTIAAYVDETNNNWSVECNPCALGACWRFNDPFGTPLGVDNGNGTITSVFENAFSNPSEKWRIQLVMDNYTIGNAFTFGNLTGGVFTGLIRVWSGGNFDGSLVFSGTLAQAQAASPIAGGTFDMRAGTSYTLELSWVEDTKC